MIRVGLYPGTVDPIHNGHLVAASEVGIAAVVRGGGWGDDTERAERRPGGVPWHGRHRRRQRAQRRQVVLRERAAIDAVGDRKHAKHGLARHDWNSGKRVRAIA